MRRNLVLAVVLSSAVIAFAQEDPDRKRPASALYHDGLKAEAARPPNLALAIGKYKKAVEKAKTDKNDALAAEILVRIANANERLEPESIAEAKAAYDEVVSGFSGVKPWGDLAKERVSYKGVDVWLRQFAASLDSWRVAPERSVIGTAEKPGLNERKDVAWTKIKALDKDAIPGLVWGLGHPDDVVRDFAAEGIAEVTDEAGVGMVIAKLNDPDAKARAGAGDALRKIFGRFNDAAAYDRRASELERERTSVVLEEASTAKTHHDKLGEEAKKLQAKAAEVRRNIPASLNTPEIQGALQKIIEDDAAWAQARRTAALAAGSIGRISGPLVDALLKGMDVKDRNVREACVRAAGAVDTSISADKHKLADRVIKAVMDEPAKAEDRSAADWSNDEIVRQAAAESLEQIALVKSLPALIKALDDNDTRVRGAAIRALKTITGKEFDYEADKPLKERQEAQKKWQEWFDAGMGVAVLVERFWIFQSTWKGYPLVKLFDPAAFTKEIESRSWMSKEATAKNEEERAKRVLEDFQRRKDVFVQDAVDLPAKAFEPMSAFIGGVTEKESKPNAATRTFVAEALAKMAEKHGGTEKLSQMAGEGDGPKKAGACLAIGFLSKDKVGAPEREALQVKGLGASEPEVRDAAARSLARVGDDGSAADLTRVATDGADVNVQIAALRALSAIHPKGDTVKALSDLVADEPPGGTKQSKNGAVREAAVDALGNIGDPAATQALLRARRDTVVGVRIAATIAIQKIAKADGKGMVDPAMLVLKDEKKKTDDRSGAALLLADTGDAAVVKPLTDRLFDSNPPRIMRDPDSGVRAEICRALGNLKTKSKTAVERLVFILNDDAEKPVVKFAAYHALSMIFGLEPEKEGSPDKDKAYRAADPMKLREEAAKKWKSYVQSAGLSD